MTVTREDLENFNRFAVEKLANGGIESLSRLASEWEECRETISDILEGHGDFEAGRHKPVDQAFRDIRDKLGWTE